MKKRKTLKTNLSDLDPKKKQERILDTLGMMKHRELISACIARGLSFEKVSELDHNGLGSFFIKNFDTTEDPSLLSQYDTWLENHLEDRGYKKGDAILSPLLRLGYVGKGDFSDVSTKVVEPGTIAKKIPEAVKLDKVKREKDEKTGVVSGTKKNLTYQLCREGIDIKAVIEKVKAAFPEAEEKSIKIWYKRCKKEIEENGND